MQLEQQKIKFRIRATIMKLIGITWGGVKNTETCKNCMLRNLKTKEQNEMKRQNKLMKWKVKQKILKQSENQRMERDNMKCRALGQAFPHWSSVKSQDFISFHEL